MKAKKSGKTVIAKTKGSFNTIISSIVAVTLAISLVPMLQTTPAFGENADGGGSLNSSAESTATQTGTSNLSSSLMSIEGIGYRALSDSEKQEILDGYLSDGIITEKDLDNKFITDSLTGAYLESVKASLGEEGLQCGNCLGLDGEVEEEIQQEGLPLQQAQDYSELSQVFELETTEQTSTQESTQKNVGDSSPQLLRENIIGSDPVLMASLAESAIVSSPTPQNTTSSGYSTDLVLKNLQSVTIYDSYYQQQLTEVDFTYIKNNPENNSVLVKAYGMPSFYCAIKDARWENGKAYLTLKLPTFADEPEQTMEVFYSNGVVVWSDKFVQIERVSGFPSVSDQAALASLQSVNGYDASRAQAYKNAYKLSPFASLEDIVKSGNAIPAGSPLATKEIRESWPIHKEDGMKVSLFNGQEQDIVKNFVYFADGTFQIYDLDFIGKSNCTASYVMGDSGILYQPDFWLIDENSKPGVDRIADFIKSKTWNTYFKSFMGSTTMHRSVRDYFDNEIVNQADEIAANLISNMPNWNALDSSSETWNRMMGDIEKATPTNSNSSTATENKMFNILFLYTYYQRFFDFEIGGSKETGFQNNANAFLVMAFRGGVINPGLSLLSLTPTVRSSSMATYGKISKLSTDVFPSLFKPYSGISTIPQLIETLVSRTSGYTDTADWFADYLPTFAFYHEYKPPVIEGYPETDQLTYRGWDQAKRYPNSLPLWLTMKPGAMYMASGSMLLIAGPTGIYEARAELTNATRESYKKRFDNIFLQESQYASTVATFFGKDKVNGIGILGCDASVSKYDTGKTQAVNFESQGLWGVTCTEDPYHKNYTDVTGYYLPSIPGAVAMTINQSLTSKRIHFLTYNTLGCGWAGTWSHEFAHCIDNDLFLDGDRRGIDNNEDYTDGLLEQSIGAISPVMNLSFSFATSADLITNYTQDRIYGKENLNDFYHKLYETMDTLDYAALKAFLRLDKDEQNAVASQIRFDGHNGNSPLDSGATATFLCSRKSVLDNYDGTVATMPVNSSVFNDGSKKFETFDEVYDNQIFLRPGISEESNATWLWANYVTEDQRGMWWFPVHCNGNRPDSRSFKVEMYRMLGREGYDAFAEFARYGGGDLYKLQKITGYSSFKEWQKSAYDAIEAKKDSLEYVDFDDLVNKFEAALKTDAAKHDRNLNSTHSLRMRMLYMMKRVTDDFRSGIFEPQRSVTHIRTLSDLQAVSNNPYGCYVLDNDIDASSAETGDANALISGVFYGKFDGQGHKILSKGRILPNVFQGIKHAYVKDLALEGVGTETLAAAINNCEIENISYKKLVREIWTVDDLVGMNDDLKVGVNEFNLMADLDFTEWSTANAAADTKKLSVVTQLMAGTQSLPKKFNGNGHTITGLSGASLFDKVCYAEIRGLSIKNSSNMQDAASGDNVSLVARRSAKSVFSDLYLDTVSAQGRYRVGFIVGDDGGINQTGAEGRIGGSRFERIQVTNGRLWNGNSSVQGKCCYAGFIAGRVTNSDLTDIFVQGAMTLYGVSSGGVVGAITCSARMDRCVSKVDVSATVANSKNGVVFGDIENATSNAYDADNTRISACFGLGSPTNANAARLGGMTAPAGAAFVNCYESLSNNTAGQTLVGASVPGVSYARIDLERLDYISKDLQNAAYTFPMLCRNGELYESLGFDPNVWDIEPTIEAGYPMLRYVGDKAAFSQYDMDIKIDYENEKLVCSGSSFDAAKMIYLHNLPYRAITGANVGEWEADYYPFASTPFKWITADPNSIDLSEIIEYEGFNNAETDLKGTRTVTLYFKTKFSGKSYSYVKSVELSPRQENPYTGVIRGIRAGSDGMGSIHVLTVGCDAMPAIEYRPVAQANDGAEDEDSASENAAEWIPITSSSTRVPAGTYEVRASATDSSFASYPSTIVVGEYEPEATSFPLVLDPNGGTLGETCVAIENYDSANTLALPGAAELARPGYTFEGWFAKDGSGNFTGEAVREIAAGGTSAVVLYAKWTKAGSSTGGNTDENTDGNAGGNTGGNTSGSTGGNTGSGQGGTVAPAPIGSRTPVKAPTMTVYAANVSTGKLTLANGKSFSLKGAAVVKRKGTVAATGKVRYKSSNPKVVTVSASGKVKASKKRTGRAKITITSVDNPANKKVVTVTVVKKAKYKAAKKIMKTSLKASYKANAKKAYSVSVKKWSPASPSNKNIVVSVSPKSRASVNPATGKITFKKKGTVKVTVRSAIDPRAKIVVKVKVK